MHVEKWGEVWVNTQVYIVDLMSIVHIRVRKYYIFWVYRYVRV